MPGMHDTLHTTWEMANETDCKLTHAEWGLGILRHRIHNSMEAILA